MIFDSPKHQLKNIISSALAEVDVQINGDRPWDIKVHNENLYPRVIGQGSLGLGEAYVEGWKFAEIFKDDTDFEDIMNDLRVEKRLKQRIRDRVLQEAIEL